MAGRLKTMPKSLNDSLASSQGAPCSPGSGWSRSKSIADSNQSEVSHGDGVTFASQDRLPKLPIPELKGTCQKYLEVLKPLQSAREHESTKAAVADFLANDGPPLQEQLRKYATGKSSYIEQFCTWSVEWHGYLWHGRLTRVGSSDPVRVRLISEFRQS